MDVLEELKATITIWRLEHRNVGVVAIKADGSVGPPATDRVAADDRETEVGEKGERRREVADGDADVLEFDGHASHATEHLRPAIAVADPKANFWRRAATREILCAQDGGL